MDARTETLIERIRDLRDSSERLWDMAVDTCIDVDGAVQPERQKQAEESRESALASWDAAETAIEAGDHAKAIAELRDAASLGSDWGDDSTEREAIALLRD